MYIISCARVCTTKSCNMASVSRLICLKTHAALTSVSGGQLNDDDYCFHLSELNLKKYACAFQLLAGSSIKKIKPLKCFNCQWLPKKIVTSLVANRRRAGIALLRILWKT